MIRRRPTFEGYGIRWLDEAAPAAEKKPQSALAPAETPAPKKRREWPIGTLAFLGVVGGGLLIRGAGVGPRGRVELEDEVQRTFAVSTAPRIDVDAFNGPIEIVRGEEGKIDCLVTRRGSGPDQHAAEDDLKNVVVSMANDAGTVKVSVRRGAGPGPRHGGSAQVRVRVPLGTMARLKSENGPINVERIEGPLDARTSNGRIEVEGATGPVALATRNGPISCEAKQATVAAEASNGAVEFRGSLAPGYSSFRTKNGHVTLRLPASPSFHVDAQARNGKVSSDFPLQSSRSADSKRLVGDVGEDPQVSVQVRTDNGGIRVHQDD